ncbi:phosphatase PAP2 family protein [Sulfobacillus harzensis]|uniref:Phosphatase PAP2 family protein n=1 Tax=Sulfobacillus harzensis TaxID=2729629 RepID=A0A7Y0L0U5_9FIRM|nr:phosphatase PAP2 family protein [Sulfobacillus harzensis]NMP21231.1 phosphatase PAP2 family protein [Sulfobacillus harzensis]
MVHPGVNSFDFYVQHWVNAPAGHNAILDLLGVVLAKFAPEIWALIFIVMWFWPPYRRTRARRAVVYSVVAGVVALVINVIISHVTPYRPRPFVLEPHLVHQLITHPKDTSFPSDHAAGSFGFAIGLLYAGVGDGIWALILAFAVAWARVFVGVHWPTDVLFGGLVGVVAGFLVLGVRGKLEWLVNLVYIILRVPPEGARRADP